MLKRFFYLIQDYHDHYKKGQHEVEQLFDLYHNLILFQNLRLIFF